MPQAIHISPIDNVVVALHPIAKGTLVEVDGLAVTALEDIPQGHKMAVKMQSSPLRTARTSSSTASPSAMPPLTPSRYLDAHPQRAYQPVR